MERPSFTFRLERVRSLRERAEEQAREALAQELIMRLRDAATLEAAAERVADARRASLRTATSNGATGPQLLAAQAWISRTAQAHEAAALHLDRRDAEVDARRANLATAARERDVIDRLASRQKAEFDAEWAVREQNALDEMALAVHRRGVAA